MANKTPRKAESKKPSKTLKEKRLAKQQKANAKKTLGS